MICKHYSPTLVEKLSFFYGRIGVYCDDCNETECEHNFKNLNDKGINNGHALSYVGHE